jgi:hypothetical protein
MDQQLSEDRDKIVDAICSAMWREIQKLGAVYSQANEDGFAFRLKDKFFKITVKQK